MKGESPALLALEQRVRARVIKLLARIVRALVKFLAGILRAIGHAVSGGELLSRHDFHTTLTGTLNTAQTEAEATTRAGYQAGAQLARITVAAELHHLGYEIPSDLPDLGGYLDALIVDERAAFGAALLDLQRSITDAHDGVQGDGDLAPVRLVTTRQAIDRATGRLGVRVLASAVNAVHRGYSDAQLALYAEFAEQHPGFALQKRWEVRSATPCTHCKALDGQIIDLTQQFDHTLTTDDTAPLKVYRDLHAPPRHPNCRCRLVLEIVRVHAI